MKTNVFLIFFAFAKMFLHFKEVYGMHVRQVEVGIDNDLTLIEAAA